MDTEFAHPGLRRARPLSPPEIDSSDPSSSPTCLNPEYCDVTDNLLSSSHFLPLLEQADISNETKLSTSRQHDSLSGAAPEFFNFADVSTHSSLLPDRTHIPITGDGPEACCPFETAFACISLHKTNRLRLLQFPAEDIVSVREIISHFWPSKLHSEREYAAAYEFKFHGNPWLGQGNEAIASRIVIREIFAYLYSVGWLLHVTTDVSRKDNDKDTMIFRNQGKPPPKTDWLSISFNQRNRLRLIGADEDLIAAFKLLMKNMRLWDKDEWKEEHNNAFEMRLHDHPWWPVDEETVTMRALLLKMLETLEHHGWSVYASLDQSNGHGPANRESDSWYCHRLQEWQPGNWVHHR